MSTESPHTSTPARGPRRAWLLLFGLGMVLAALVLKNPVVILLLLTDGLTAALVLGAAALGGLALLPALRPGSLPVRWQLLFGAGLGIGMLALLVLLLGLAGWLSAAACCAVLAVSAVLGLRRLLRLRPAPPADPPGVMGWLWLLVCPPIMLAVLSASVPPGYLWAEEGNGYDVLEYHLQMPKEYLAAQRIQYAPHNVYANFPANVEMLYLLCMVLEGEAIDAAGTCQMLHALLGALAVATAWAIGRDRSPAAGVVTAVVTAGAGWLSYLCGLAYVENGLLFFGLLALAALLRGLRDASRCLWWCAAAGLFAGYAAGCKYTALALVGLPLTGALLLTVRGALRRRLAAAACFLLAQGLAFAPWAAKNTALTGNPLFPLAAGVFDGHPEGWGAAEARHFAASHAPAGDEGSLGRRLALLWRHLPGDRDQRFGPPVLLLAGWALLGRRRDRVVSACGWMLLAQVPVWLFATHLYARFAVPLLIPLVVLAGSVPLGGPRQRAIVSSLLVAGTLFNLAFSTRLYAQHMLPGGVQLDLEGATDAFTGGVFPGYEHLGIVNQDLPGDAHLCMVGDARAFYVRRRVAYCVVFNRSPLVETIRAASGPRDVVGWLAAEGYTHLLVNWAEIDRLRRSRYGYPPEVTRELFAALVVAGLEPVARFPEAAAQPHLELYRIPRSGAAPRGD